MTKTTKRLLAVIGALILVAVLLPVLSGSGPQKYGLVSAPTQPPAYVCGNAALLNGPTSAPASGFPNPANGGTATGGTITVTNFNGGQPNGVGFVANRTYWISPGSYDFSAGGSFAITPNTNDVLIGAPGAIFDGHAPYGVSVGGAEAINGNAAHVTIEYLTIQNFYERGPTAIVNPSYTAGWYVLHNTIQNNWQGAGVGVASNSVTDYNCLTGNGQYGFNDFTATGGSSYTFNTNVTVSNNEISYNDTDGQFDEPGAPDNGGDAGGGKFWTTSGVTFTNNYVHNNSIEPASYGSSQGGGDPGVWFDTDVSGANISNNYVSYNGGPGIQYELSYNAQIIGNTIIGNGRSCSTPNPSGGCDDFVDGAIYIADSGGDTNVSAAGSGYTGQGFEVSNNVLINNWDGIMVWNDPERYCGDIFNGGTLTSSPSDGVCTLDSPQTYYNYPNGGTTVSYSGSSTTVTGTFPQTVDGISIVGDAIGGNNIPKNDYITAANGCTTTCTSVTLNTMTTGSGTNVNYTSCSSYNLNNQSSGSSFNGYTNLWSLCRWKTQNVVVENNTLNFNPTAVGAACINQNPITGPTETFECGFNGLASAYGALLSAGAPWTATPPWLVNSPTTNYGLGNVENFVVNTGGNVFRNNTYNGPWQFTLGTQNQSASSSEAPTFAHWQSGYTDSTSGVPYTGQDVGSTYNPTPPA